MGWKLVQIMWWSQHAHYENVNLVTLLPHDQLHKIGSMDFKNNVLITSM